MKEILSHAGAIKFMIPYIASVCLLLLNGYSMTVTWKYWALYYTHRTLCTGHWLGYSVRLNCARQSTDWPHISITDYMLNSACNGCKPIQPYQFN